MFPEPPFGTFPSDDLWLYLFNIGVINGSRTLPEYVSTASIEQLQALLLDITNRGYARHQNAVYVFGVIRNALALRADTGLTPEDLELKRELLRQLGNITNLDSFSEL